MKLEDQVCSLDLAKKLKELGVRHESVFYYFGDEHELTASGFTPTPKDNNEYENCIAAFTVAELGEMLKAAGPKATMKAYSHVYNFIGGTEFVGSLGLLRLLTEPDLLARMLIHLLENKLITV